MEPKIVGVAGLGLLGRGIVACFVTNGLRVVAFDKEPETRQQATRSLAAAVEDVIQHVGLSSSLREEWRNRYTEAESIDSFRQCDFIIESITEDLAAKKSLFTELEKVVGANVPIASNTSSIPITLLQQQCTAPERILGMHWCEPAYANRFLEVIRGEQTSDAAVTAAMDLARIAGKEPSLVQKDIPAFIVNRMAYAIYREALYMQELGVADIETIDRSFRNACGIWATICGPFRWIDLTGGPALYGRVMQRTFPTLSNTTEVPELAKALMESDARGIANGRGFYNYSEQEKEQWEELLHKHAWRVNELMNEYFPLDQPK